MAVLRHWVANTNWLLDGKQIIVLFEICISGVSKRTTHTAHMGDREGGTTRHDDERQRRTRCVLMGKFAEKTCERDEAILCWFFVRLALPFCFFSVILFCLFHFRCDGSVQQRRNWGFWIFEWFLGCEKEIFLLERFVPGLYNNLKPNFPHPAPILGTKRPAKVEIEVFRILNNFEGAGREISILVTLFQVYSVALKPLQKKSV